WNPPPQYGRPLVPGGNVGSPVASFGPGAKKAGLKPIAPAVTNGPNPTANRSVTCNEAMGLIERIERLAKIGPTPKKRGGWRGVTTGVVRLPGKLTPPPTRPKIPRPRVKGESSLRRKEKPVARPEATPLSLRDSPNRFVGGNRPPTAPAGSELCR